MILNNGNRRPGGQYSSVEEIEPPVDSSGNYALEDGQAYGPATPTWTYAAANTSDFFSGFASGAHRLPNGNTFITSADNGTMFEVSDTNTIVWKYVNPVSIDGPMIEGTEPSGNTVFRAHRYAPDFPGLVGRELTPGGPLGIVIDSDGDGLSDLDETKIYGTRPFEADSDLDGLSDGDEILVYGTSPVVADTDGDGLSDGDEVLMYGTDPTQFDTDGDGVSDGDEILVYGTDPLLAPLLGDANCDEAVSSIDAALILQFVAGLTQELPCQQGADMNGDGMVNAIDAALVLQFTAGLMA